jgi:hypothetical protein
MSRYNKWHGGYFYGTWKPKKKEEGGKSSSSSESGSWKDYWRGTYGKETTTYYDDDVVDYESVYRSRYTSSIGYSGIGGSLYSGGAWSSGYSSYSYGTSISGDKFKDLSALILRAVKEARDLIVILDFPFTVKMNFTADGYGAPGNTREIFIPTDYIEDSSRTDEDKIRIFCSLACNEAAHLKYTEYRIFETFREVVKGKGFNSTEIGFINVLFNIIEDERVEDLLLKERPGYLDFIEKGKVYQYERFIEASKSIPDTKAGQFLLNLFKLIRFPKNVDMDIINEFSDLYENIGSIISPLPDSTKETCNVSVKVFQAINEVISSDKFDFTPPPGSGGSRRDMIMKLLKDLTDAGEHGFESVTGGYDSAKESIYGDKSRVHSSLLDKATGHVIEGMCDGSVYLGEGKDTIFTVAQNNRDQYESDRKAIASYVPMIRKLIKGYDKNFDFNIFGCRSGLLDTTKLAEAYQGVPQVYVRKGTVQTNKLAVIVLIDESGSMACGPRMTSARRSAILLNEALKNQPGVELFVYGHSADETYSGATEINIYKEGKVRRPFSLGTAQPRYENRDGTAIYEVAKRVRKLTNNHILMFVISDGYPAAHGYHGMAAVQDVRKNVDKVSTMDIDVVQISIEYISHAKDMFKNFIDLSGDAGNLAKNLSNTIKKLIIQNKKTTITQ